jgi:hypothetical protein
MPSSLTHPELQNTVIGEYIFFEDFIHASILIAIAVHFLRRLLPGFHLDRRGCLPNLQNMR